MDYSSIISAKLRKPGRAPEPSVMTRPAEPEWQPEYINEPPLESVSPEDWIPNPKSVVAALKGAPALLGMAKFKLPSVEKQLLHDRYTNNNAKTMSGLAQLTPSQFLAATVPAGSDYIESRSGKVDPYKLFSSGLPDLITNATVDKLIGHESRHRLSALRKAGVDEPVPVRVSKNFRSGLREDEVAAMSNALLRGQDYGKHGAGSPLDLGEIIPMSWNNRDRVLATQKEVDIPLKNVGVLMRPEGPQVTEADIKAFQRGYVPYGKINPPKPRRERSEND